MNLDVQKMRKTNTKIFPTYKSLSWDYLFFYTIDFLFLTQIKGFSASDVVLKSTFYSLFMILMQIPANIIIEFLGRKNSIIFGNVLNCFYLLIVMMSKSLGDIIFAEFISAIAFALKTIAEPSLLSESIAPSKYKSKIYARVNGKGSTGYYALNAISKVVAGFLFTINSYLPIICSLIICIIVVLISMIFIEPVQKKKKGSDAILYKKELKDIKEGFIYVVKSERLKALILCSALMVSLLSILSNYYVSLFEDLNISAITIGIIAAVGCIISSYASKTQQKIQDTFKNKTLITIAILLSISTIISGILGINNKGYITLIVIITIMYLIYQFGHGAYYTMIEKYLSNFSNEKIDTKIFATSNLFSGCVRVMAGLCASFLLGKFTTAYCMIIVGIIFTVIYILVEKYMNKRVGLKPEEYSKEETKYDSIIHKQ